MSALILNQGIDEINFTPMYAANNIGYFNDLNSAVEYISEIILGNKDAFPEYQKAGKHKQASSFKHISIKSFNVLTIYCPQTHIATEPTFCTHHSENYTFLFYKEIKQPPNV
jgi:hypothetical protein